MLWSLEERDFDVRLADDGRLRVAPGSALTAADRAAIRDHHDELVTLVKLCDAEAM